MTFVVVSLLSLLWPFYQERLARKQQRLMAARAAEAGQDTL